MIENQIEPVRWQLKAHVHLISASSDRVLLSWLGQRLALRTPNPTVASRVPSVLRTLGQARTLNEMEERLANEGWSKEDLRALLSVFERKGLVTRVVPENDAREFQEMRESQWWPFLQLFSTSQVSMWEAYGKISRQKISLVSQMHIPETFMKEMREGPRLSFERSTMESLQDGSLNLVVCSPRELVSLNESSVRALGKKDGPKLVPVLIDLFGAVVGPIVGGPGRPCLQCLARRLGSGKASAERVLLSDGCGHEVVHAWPRTFWQKLEAIIFEEVFKMVSGLVISPLQRGAYVLDFLNHRGTYEEYFPVPGCACNASYLTEHEMR